MWPHDPALLTRAILPSEQALEDMIVAAPQMLSDSWMLIGRQERTTHGGRIDLLAIAADGALILIEISATAPPAKSSPRRSTPLAPLMMLPPVTNSASFSSLWTEAHERGREPGASSEHEK